MLRVTIDRGACQGARECAHAAPATFYLDDTVTAAVHDPIGDPDDVVFEAADCCPNAAILVERISG